MLNINPLLLVGGVIGAVTALLIFAYASVKDKKTAMGFERTMADGEILRRLFAYAKPYWAKFLLVLFLISVAGPMLGIRWVTLVTAFGIALVKAHKVAAEFMHLKIEKRIATLIMASMVVVMLIFFFGVAPDVMKASGQRWVKHPPTEHLPAGGHEAAPAEHHE